MSERKKGQPEPNSPFANYSCYELSQKVYKCMADNIDHKETNACQELIDEYKSCRKNDLDRVRKQRELQQKGLFE